MHNAPDDESIVRGVTMPCDIVPVSVRLILRTLTGFRLVTGLLSGGTSCCPVTFDGTSEVLATKRASKAITARIAFSTAASSYSYKRIIFIRSLSGGVSHSEREASPALGVSHPAARHQEAARIGRELETSKVRRPQTAEIQNAFSQFLELWQAATEEESEEILP